MKKKKDNVAPLTWAEVDLRAIRYNFKEAQKLCRRRGQKRTKILAVVKADAYGHGMLPVASLLNKIGVDFFGVSSVSEGIALRQKGIKKPILLFESTLPLSVNHVLKHNLTPTVCTIEMAKALNRAAGAKRKKIDIHIKVDTGMGRLGVWHKDAVDFVEKLNVLNYLSIKGIYTHFPSADTDPKFTKKQILQLDKVVKALDKMALVVPYIHAANSMGLVGYPTKLLNFARLGLMLYGLYPTPRMKKAIKLRPALSVKSTIIFIKEINKGRSISYGRTFIAKKRMRVATIPVGYNDGYLRSFSNKACVLVKGVRCPVLGRVTMNQIIIDVTKVKLARLGTTVTLLGEEKGKKVSADELAGYANTINYEIACSLGNRLPKQYK